jgi:hypothetical protein
MQPSQRLGYWALTMRTRGFPVPPAETRCEKTELLVSQCGHCLGVRPEDPGAAEFGPWFLAQYTSVCAGCPETIYPGDPARADGQGGYVGECCGN